MALLAGYATEATYMPISEPLEARIREAELVISGRVRIMEEAKYPEKGRTRLCGITYAIDVLKTYKGRSQQNLEFSVYRMSVRVPFHTVNVGDDLLLLLHTERGRSDPALDEVPDVVLAAPSGEKSKCLDRLAPLRVDSRDGAYPLIHELDQKGEATTWLAYSSALTTMPDIAGQRPYAKDCRGERCGQDGRRLVRWDILEAKIIDWLKKP